MTQSVWLDLGGVLAAGLLGYVTSAILSGWLHLPRRVFLVPYFVFAGTFLSGFCYWNQIDLIRLLTQNWRWGLLAGAIVGAFLVRNVRCQAASARSTGIGLVFDGLWVGVGYGSVDALLLNVMPVLAVWSGLSTLGWSASWPGELATGFLALLASLLVTLLYHLGYPEFRNRRVALVLFGNALITLAFLVSGNPLGAVVSHIAMHVAAVFQGPETMIQLPPHYSMARVRLAESS